MPGLLAGDIQSIGPGASSVSVDGSPMAAKFPVVTGLAVDGQGNVFAAQVDRIRRIDTNGVVTTIAGGTNTNVTYLDGAGASARFGRLQGIAVDSRGNLFVADSGNSAIRTLSPAGVVSTLVGGPNNRGYVDGPINTAKLNGPVAIAIDSKDNLFVVDLLDVSVGCASIATYVVRKISPSGVVSTVARPSGSKTILPAKIAVDSVGNLYVTTTETATPDFVFTCPAPISSAAYITKISSDGSSTIFAGTSGLGFVDGLGSQARFEYLTSIAIDSSDNLYVADARNGAARRISPQGLVTTVVGQRPGTVTSGASLTLGNLPGVVPYLDEVTVRPLSTLFITANNHTLTNPATSARVILKAEPR